MPYEKFKCESCGIIFSTGKLTRRGSMPGQYCPQCGEKEKCAACGELYPRAMITFMDDVKNYICDDCKYDYKDVAEYIKPAPHFQYKPGPGRHPGAMLPLCFIPAFNRQCKGYGWQQGSN